MINIVLHKISGIKEFETEFLNDPSSKFVDVDWSKQSEDVNVVYNILYPDKNSLEFYAFTYVCYLDQFPEVEKLIDDNPFEKTYKVGNTRSIPMMYIRESDSNTSEPYPRNKLDISLILKLLEESSSFLKLLDNSMLSTAFYYAVTDAERLSIALAAFTKNIKYS